MEKGEERVEGKMTKTNGFLGQLPFMGEVKSSCDGLALPTILSDFFVLGPAIIPAAGLSFDNLNLPITTLHGY